MIETCLSLFDLTAAGIAGLSSVSLFFVLFLGTFISEDATCVAAGTLSASGEISFTLAVSSCFAGILAGDMLLYWIGRLAGTRFGQYRIANRFVSERSIASASRWLNEKGPSAVFLSRFVTGLRLPTYLAAGFLKADFARFAFYFVIASAIWTPIVVGSAAFSGTVIGSNLLIAVVCALVALKLVKKFATWRERRITIGKFKRIINWEFWPLSVFYLPVAFYVILLGAKYRSLTLFTCANPGIPAGGFVGESKDQIYSMLAGNEENRAFMLRHQLIENSLSAAEKIGVVDRFVDDHRLSFPVVLKPNAGERGKGVRIVKTRSDLEAMIPRLREDYIVQEFFPGDELGVFYYRHPSEATGRIFSITRKTFPTVTGDGVSKIEELILRDERAVRLAPKYFAENRSQLDRVPEPGEQVRLIEIGTHSRGAIFVDGDDLRTPALENSIDAISRRTPGFYFGRFDIRFSSVEDLRAGTGFKIIELNGVTSESTNIYDPRYSLLDAYRILFEQWRIAFEIGDENARGGARATPAIELICAGLRVSRSKR